LNWKSAKPTLGFCGAVCYNIFMLRIRREHQKLQKAVIILGPTACGKTAWSLKLAKKFNGNIISADSRQVYKKMDIGTGKELGEWRWNGLRHTYYIQDIPHHLIDFLDPGIFFAVTEFRDKATKYIKLAHKHNHLPIVVGGTGLYIQALVDNLKIPRVAPNKKLRQSLEEKTEVELMEWLRNLDDKTAQTIDPKNKRRVIRALEVCILSGEPFSTQQGKGEPIFDILQIGIDISREELYQRIDKRIEEMMLNGLLAEVKALLKQKYSWNLSSLSGIGYRQFKDYFTKQITLPQAVELLKRDTRRYSKRQLTWFKRDQRIKWCTDYEQAEKLVVDFIKN